jgi:hypothetical protein
MLAASWEQKLGREANPEGIERLRLADSAWR